MIKKIFPKNNDNNNNISSGVISNVKALWGGRAASLNIADGNRNPWGRGSGWIHQQETVKLTIKKRIPITGWKKCLQWEPFLPFTSFLCSHTSYPGSPSLCDGLSSLAVPHHTRNTPHITAWEDMTSAVTFDLPLQTDCTLELDVGSAHSSMGK